MIQQTMHLLNCIGNTDGITIYYEQETGTDQINAGGVTTAIIGTITLVILTLHKEEATGAETVGMPDLRGDGEVYYENTKIYTRFYFTNR